TQSAAFDKPIGLPLPRGSSYKSPTSELTEIQLPGIPEKFTFAYNSDGSIAERTLPTGAKLLYDFDHYAVAPMKRFHTELVRRTVLLADATIVDPDCGESGVTCYSWLYSRFGDGIPRTFDERMTTFNGHGYSASNPNVVRVYDPFGNVTRYV